MPPSRLDVGAGGAVADGTDGRFRVSYGASLAAALRSDIPVDVTAGVIGDVPSAKKPKAEAAHWAVGMFFEPSVRVHRWHSGDTRFRLWVAPRIELFPDEHMGRSYLLRSTFEIAWSIRAAGTSGGKKSFMMGGVYGTGGIGIYLEGGMRQLPQDVPGVLVTGGIMVRFPAAAGLMGIMK